MTEVYVVLKYNAVSESVDVIGVYKTFAVASNKAKAARGTVQSSVLIDKEKPQNDAWPQFRLAMR